MKLTSAVVRLALERAWAYRFLQNVLVRSNTRQSLIGRYVQPRARDRIVDIGCGPADILEHLPDVHYFGIDANPDYVRVARARYGARANFIEGGLETLRDIPAASADIIMAIALLHHLDDGEANELFREARRILAPGGRIFTIDCVTVADQNPISRFLISHDRGKYPRTPDGYRALAAPFFSNISQHHRNDMMRVPYDHLLMTCG
jgi:SAM-dependent methyltransferase